jgi:hypothetical protein
MPFGSVRIGDVEQDLADGQAAQQDHHVDREQLAPGLVGRPVVQPALRHHVEPGVAEAGDEAHGAPGNGLDEDAVD